MAPRHLRDIDAIQRDAPGVNFVEAHDEIDQRRLAGPGGPDYGDRMARFGSQVQILDQRLVGCIAERDRLESQVSARHFRGSGIDRIGALLLGVQDLKHALGRGHTGLQQIGHRAQLCQGLRELS